MSNREQEAAADVTAPLAEIRARHRPSHAVTLAKLIAAATTTHAHADGPVIVQGCVVTDARALKDAVRALWFRDMPALLTVAEQTEALADQLAGRAARLRTHSADTPIEAVIERTERADDLQHAADTIREVLAAAFTTTETRTNG